jgi:hypothetical protein
MDEPKNTRSAIIPARLPPGEVRFERESATWKRSTSIPGVKLTEIDSQHSSERIILGSRISLWC